MATLLRTGKFLRLFSGAARNLAATNGQKTDETGLTPTTGLCFDSNALCQANFSIQNVLPYLGVSDSGHAEDRFPTRLLSTPNRNLGRVTKQEIEAILGEIKSSEVTTSNANLLSSQECLALLAIRLCGTVLDQEVQIDRSELVASIWEMVIDMKLPLTVVHYNALLRVHLENKFQFDPEAISNQMKEKKINPDKETYQCFISAYCQRGDIEGASKVLQTMKKMGYSVNENIFNSLIIGHSQNGDLGRAQGIVKVMKQCGLNPSTETYLTLACAFARVGDISSMDRTVAESCQAGCGFQDGDYLELLFVLCESEHKDQVGKILDKLHPETEEFGWLASHLTVRLVNAGHDDVAYNLVQFTVENSAEESGRVISGEFLDQLVRMNTTVSKLIWILKDMSDRKIYSGGMGNLIDLALKNGNLALALKLSDVLIAEGGKVTKKQFKQMIMLSKKSGDDNHEGMFACVRIGSKFKYLSAEMLKRHVFPSLDTWPELTIAQLEEFGLSRMETVTAMIEYLVGKGETEAASTVAGIFSEHVDPKLKFMTNTTNSVKTVCNHFVDETPSKEKSTAVVAPQPRSAINSRRNSAVTCVVNSCETKPSERVSRPYFDAAKLAELEAMLDTETGDSLECIYTNLMKAYAHHKMIDRAINLSRRLREEQLKIPEVYEILGQLIESQYTESLNQEQQQQQMPQISSPPPMYQPMASMHPGSMIPHPYDPSQMIPVTYISPEGYQGYFYTYPPPAPMPGNPEGYYNHAGVAYAPTASPYPPPPANTPMYNPEMAGSYPSTPYPVTMTPDFTSMASEASTELPQMSQSGRSSIVPQYPADSQQHSYLHRQLKRLVTNGEAENALSVYRNLEQAGKTVNVTETSALIEQLVRTDMMSEAVEITQSMLMRNMHPMPKIFRFLLNKLASNGAVGDINAIGNYLSSKIKKDVSYDNRLCNAYLSAGRGGEFLTILAHDLEIAMSIGNLEQLATLQDRFPRGGAMGLLDNHPELIDEFTLLAQRFAQTGYIAPMNVLWTYHFINNNMALADTIWQQHVRSSNQIMFQKVCQVARSTGNLNLAFGLVNKLHEADQVTPGARGIAYSCLLDCLAADSAHKQGFEVLKEAIQKGIKLEDINRTALVRLKAGIEEIGEDFPYTIPPKNPGRMDNEERSLSPLDWSQE